MSGTVIKGGLIDLRTPEQVEQDAFAWLISGGRPFPPDAPEGAFRLFANPSCLFSPRRHDCPDFGLDFRQPLEDVGVGDEIFRDRQGKGQVGDRVGFFFFINHFRFLSLISFLYPYNSILKAGGIVTFVLFRRDIHPFFAV